MYSPFKTSLRRKPAIPRLLTITAFLAFLSTSLLHAESTKSRFVQNLEAGKKQTLVAYGTSLSAVGAWVDQLSSVADQQFPGLATVVNGAQGGANSDWGREKLEEKVLAHHPDTVLIEFSVNDAVSKLKNPTTRARENLENMIDRILKSNPATEIILMVMNPPVGHAASDRPNLAAFNQMYRDVAKERGFQLIDHFPEWEKMLKQNPALFLQCMPDAIHPMRTGSLLVSAPLVIRSLGLAAGTPDASGDKPMERYLFISLMDKDKSGKVTFGEFQAYWTSQFEKTDTDENGALNSDELHSAELLAFFDTNNDSQVTLGEYLPKFLPVFEQYADPADQSINTMQFPRKSPPKANQPTALVPARPNEWWFARHEEKLREVSENAAKIDLVFVGDSITQGLERPESANIVAGTFPGMTVLNLGYNADKTENVLWRLRNGEIDDINPKGVVLMIGTNQSGHRSDPPEITTKGIGMILAELRAKLPNAKIALLSIFPRGDAPNALNQKINALLPTLADGKTIFHLDLNDAFLDSNGHVPPEIMPDKLHPSDKGNDLWMKALKPRLDQILAAPSAS